MRIPMILAAALALALVPDGLTAQTAQRWSIQLSGIGNLVGGVTDGELDPGGGGEIQIRMTPGALSLGVGLESTKQNGLRECGAVPAGGCWDEDVELQVTGFFLEPRWTKPLASSVALYLSGRFGASGVKRTSEITEFYHPDAETDALGDDLVSTTLEANWSGWTANVGGGILVRLSDRVNLDIGATVGRKGFGSGDLTATLPGGDVLAVEEDIELGTVNNAVLRVGIAIGLGG